MKLDRLVAEPRAVASELSSDTKVSHMSLYRRASYRRRIIHVCLSLGCLGVRLYM